MTEQQIQSKKIKELEAQGYYVIKLIKTNKNGIPDLIAIPRNSDVLFIEVKAGKTYLAKMIMEGIAKDYAQNSSGG